MKSASILLRAMFVALMLTVGLSQAQAQIQITVGTATLASTGTDMKSPYSRWYTSEHKQYLVTAAELNAAGAAPGDIKGLAFNVSSAAGAGGTCKGWTMKMKLTTATNVATPFDISGFTQVVDPTDMNVTTTGWYQHDFGTTIFWDGTSNIMVDVCYNNYFGGADYNTAGANVWCSIPAGVTTSMYVGYTDGANYCGSTVASLSSNYRPQMRFEFRPVGVKNTFPKGTRIVGMPDSSLLRSNAIYNGTNSEAPSASRPGVTFGSIPGFTTTFTYTITGPLPSNNIVYRGMDAAGQTTMTAPAGGGNMFIPNADGILANPSAPTVQNGTGFLNTAVPPNQGGTYRLTVVATTSKGTSSFVQTVVNDFVVAVDRDMTAVGLSRPLGKNQQVYFKTNNIPITAQFKNVGVQPVMSYKGICEIRNATTGVLVRHDEVIRSTSSGIPPTGIVTGAIDEFDFPSFTSIQADSFSITICTEMIDPIPDQQAFNDCYPLAGAAPFTFIVKNLIDYETVNITSPASGIYAGRPATPSAQIANNGAFADPIPVFLNITLLPNTPIVTNQMMLVEVPNGIFNKSVVSFPPFTPPAGGQYQICIKAAQQGDEVPANDEKCVTITVIDRLAGDFTVGANTKPGVPGFPTIQAAVDALFQRGVRANVRFLLTDPFYSVGSTANVGSPALDLSSNIIGVGPNSTVTWMADPQSTGLSKAGVTIQLNSANGIGVLLGQNAQPANFNAVQLEFPNRDNANSPGYMNFDGGAQKSLKFQLRTFANRRAVFYVGRRSYNNSIQNSIIELDPSTPELDFWHTLPGVTIESNAFKFGADSAGFGANFSTFTAGIFQRNTPPANEFGNNREGLDTSVTINNVTYLGNKANKFIGNEIRGFGYGIASIGIGTLKKNNKLTRYYNSGTEIRDNMISKVRRAGIFLGYEDGAMVTGNKIFDVGLAATGKTGEANGIEVGGQQNSLTHIGFNNINCEIGRNEINGVTSDVFARGVKVQQSLNDLSSVVPPPGDYLQPSVSENMNIHGNMIWGLSRTNAGASRAGIHVFTDRNGAAGINGMITARISNYFTRNDQIANNTIMMANDNISNSGAVVGIGVQHGKSTTLMNNAIAMTGTNTTADIAGGYPHAALFYQGLHPKYVGGMTADRNAYWSPNAATVRFYEIDSISQTLLAGYQDEYQTLAQWRAWTKQDLNSLIGNWTGDYVTSGVAPIQYVRIKTNPSPTGSILNNRGARIANVTSDVDGQARGSAGQAYDIGADEFNGVSYVNDVEVTTILAPRSYRTGASQVNFADAEHLMVDANVKVVARLRNNGSISQVVNVVGEYAVENAASSGNSLPSYPGFSGLSNVTVQIAAGESKDVDLGVLTPQSLSQLSSYTTPIWMQKQVDSSMRVNVTPRYKIQARVTTPDENFGNNSDAMDARFYIRRSNIKMMTSWVGKSYAHTNPLNVTTDPLYARNTIARLNADSLKRGLDAMGFWSGLKTGIAIPDINYDIMDRDGWEPRSVDYTWYKTLVWSEDNTGMSRFERDNIRDFVAASNVVSSKKNFVIGSQEIVKTHVGLNAVNDEYFPRYTLRSQRGKSTAAIPAVVTTPVAAGYAMPPIVAPFRSDVVGMTIEKNITENIKGTGFVNGTWNDPLPLPALMSAYVDGFTQGLARPAFKYTTKDANVADSAMGITVTGAGTNIVHLGVDWRHYGKTTQTNGIERVLRGTLDFFDVNDGTVVPVELADFDAKAAGKSVNVFWSTASESNSGWFEVERKQAGSEFANVATVPAAGTSTSILNYGIKDENVESGATYTYRLKNVDRDGKTGYSYEVEVVIGGESTSLSLGNATPSPINNESTVSYSMSIGGEVALNLYDMMGRLVQTVDNGNRAAGAHAATINSNGLSSGMYQLVLKVGSETTTRLVQIVK